MKQYIQIEQLLVRFVDGQTSETEEKLLADYFRSAKDVPEEWKAYQAMFASFDTDAYEFTDDELDGMCLPVDEDHGASVAADRPKRNMFVRWRVCAAAAVLFGLVGSATYFLSVNGLHSDSANISASVDVNEGGSPCDGKRNAQKESSVAAMLDRYECAVSDGEKYAQVVLPACNKKNESASKHNVAHEADLSVCDTSAVSEGSSMSELSVEIPNFDQFLDEVHEMNRELDLYVRMMNKAASSEVAENAAALIRREDEERNLESAGSPDAVETVEVPSFPPMH